MLHLIASRAADNPTAFALLAPGRLPLTYQRLYEAAVSFLATSAASVCAPLNPICGTIELEAALSRLKPKTLIAWPNIDPDKRTVAETRGIRRFFEELGDPDVLPTDAGLAGTIIDQLSPRGV